MLLLNIGKPAMALACLQLGAALVAVPASAQEARQRGGVAAEALGERRTANPANVDVRGRVQARIETRVQSRITNRLERNMDVVEDASAASSYATASNQARNAARPAPDR